MVVKRPKTDSAFREYLVLAVVAVGMITIFYDPLHIHSYITTGLLVAFAIGFSLVALRLRWERRRQARRDREAAEVLAAVRAGEKPRFLLFLRSFVSDPVAPKPARFGPSSIYRSIDREMDWLSVKLERAASKLRPRLATIAV